MVTARGMANSRKPTADYVAHKKTANVNGEEGNGEREMGEGRFCSEPLRRRLKRRIFRLLLCSGLRFSIIHGGVHEAKPSRMVNLP